MLLEEIDVLVLYIDDLVPQLPVSKFSHSPLLCLTCVNKYLAPHIGEIVPVISKTAKYTPYLLADYGGITKYVHHVLSIPGAAQVPPLFCSPRFVLCERFSFTASSNAWSVCSTVARADRPETR